jgi:histidinol-phosphate aminotransferase
MFVNKYIKKLKPYPLVSHRAWEIQGSQNILKLDWNEATIQPSPRVKQSILNFLEHGNMNWYPDVNNTLLLEELSLYNNLPIENIQYFASSDSIHEYIASIFLEARDQVTIVGPTYDNFRAVIESKGAIVDFYYLDDQFQLNSEKFQHYLAFKQPHLVYICNPNNPTGTFYTQEFLQGIIAGHNNILFIVDEAYFEFYGNSCKNLVMEHNNLIITRTFSKAFALASFRVGYAISSIENIEILSKVRNPKSISTFAQIAAIAALQDKKYMMNYVTEVNITKNWFKSELKKLGCEHIGGGGNYIAIKLSNILKQRIIKTFNKKNIFVRDYSHVSGMDGYIRITIGTKEQMILVLNALIKFKNEF